MKICTPAGPSRGFTLAELAVASFLLALLLTMTLLAMQSGIRQYQTLRGEVEMQQEALGILAKLAREVGESYVDGTWPEPTALTPLSPGGSHPRGIVFLSPRDSDGKIWLDGGGKTIWQKRICVYHDPATKKLYRCVEPLASATSTPPARDNAKTTSYFRDHVPRDPLPGQIEAIRIEMGESVRNFRFNLVVSSELGPKKTILEFATSTTAKGG